MRTRRSAVQFFSDNLITRAIDFANDDTAKVISNELQLSRQAESNVTYQVEFSPDAGQQPPVWAPYTNWIVGPQDTLNIPIDSLPEEGRFRLMLPHTNY